MEQKTERTQKKMIRISLVEDDPGDAKILKEFLQQYSSETAEQISISLYQDPVRFLSEYSGSCDLVLMDIELPEMTGMECARRLRKLDGAVPLIFITNMARYAIHGYEVGAMDFMVKPVSYPSLQMKLRRAFNQILKTREHFLNLNLKNGFVRIPVSEIFYLEVQRHNLTYHTEQGNFVVRETLKSAYEKLAPYHFVHASNSYLINLRHVNYLSDGCIHMNDTDIYLSRSCKASFMKSLSDYLEGNVE